MNRYQEAWDFVKYRFYDGGETQETDGYTDYKKENFMLMQELVDKATPKKPIRKRLEVWRSISCFYICPSCGQMTAVGFKHCDKCGQHLDWGEKNEE